MIQSPDFAHENPQKNLLEFPDRVELNASAMDTCQISLKNARLNIYLNGTNKRQDKMLRKQHAYSMNSIITSDTMKGPDRIEIGLKNKEL